MTLSGMKKKSTEPVRRAVPEVAKIPEMPPAKPLTFQEAALAFGLYLAIAALFHVLGMNPLTHLLGAGDGYTAGFPSKIFAISLSPWNPYVQLGQYSFANTQFQPFYLPALAAMALLPDTLGYNLFILTHYALAGMLFYLFARNRGLASYPSAVGGGLFMLSGFLSAHKGHQAMMSTAVWLPGMLLGVDVYVAGRRARGLGWLAVALAMSILGGFPQVTVYSMILTSAYAIFRLRSGHGWVVTLRSSAVLLGGATTVAVLLSALQTLAVAEVLPYMTREKLTYQMFSEDYFPPYHALAFLMPNVLGGFFGVPTYSPDINVVEVYPYMGLLSLGLAIVAVWLGRKQFSDTWFWALTVVSGIILMVGQWTPLNRVLFHAPVYNLFRAPTRHLLEVNLAIAMLASIGLDFALRSGIPRARLARALRVASRVFAAVFAGVLIISQAIRPYLNSLSASSDMVSLNAYLTVGTARPIVEKNLAPFSPTVVYPCLFAVTSLVLLQLVGRPRRWVLAAIPLVLGSDLYLPYSTLYSQPSTINLGHPESRPETAFLRAQKFDAQQYRLYPLEQSDEPLYPLLNMTYGWSTVNDYTPMWLKRYVAVTDFALNGVAPPQNLGHPNALAAAGAQYLIATSKNMTEILDQAETVHAGAFAPLGVSFLADHAVSITPNSYRVQSPDGSTVSMILGRIALKKSTIYRVSFETAAPLGLTRPLLVNLYAEGYDHPAQYKVFERLPTGVTPQTAVIDSGAEAPAQAWVRIYSQTTAPVDIGSIRIESAGVAGDAQPPSPVYTVVYTGADGIHIYRNNLAQPRFRFVRRLRPCKDAGEARSVLEGDPTFDVGTDALVEGINGPAIVEQGEILGREIRNNDMRFTLRTGNRSFFVVADSWLPGWNASIDGKPAPIYPVDGFLRGIQLEGAGTHTVVMSYHPWSVPAGIAATLAGLILLALLWILEGRLTPLLAWIGGHPTK
jgi:hypothetical protein